MATAIGAYAALAAVKTRMKRTDTADDTFITTLCNQINGWIESPQGAGRPIAPYTATYTYDASSWRFGGRVLVIPRGIRTVTTLKLNTATGESYTTIASTDYYLRPLEQDRTNGWPATRLHISDLPAGGFTEAASTGFAIAEIAGDYGWAVIPDELKDVAETAVVRAFSARAGGQSDLIGNDETGQPLVSRFLSGDHRRLVESYRWYDGVW